MTGRCRPGFLIAALLLLLLSGCGEEDAGTPKAQPSSVPPMPQAETSERLGGFPRELFHFERDMFPSADFPKVIKHQDAYWLSDTDEVLGVEVGGIARAYPVSLLQHFHSVNDSFGKQRALVTWCSICSSGRCFDPRFEGRTLTFGFEGIVHGMALLYDRQTNSRWFHLNGECFDGLLEGHVLKPLGICHSTTFGAWKQRHPGTDVMDLPQDLERGYAPRGVWISGDDFVPPMMNKTMAALDPRLPPYDLVLGVVHKGQSIAFPFAGLARVPLAPEIEISGKRVLILFDPVDRAPAAFEAEFEGKPLTLRRVGQGVFEDAGRGIRVDQGGKLLGPSAKGRSLVPMPFVQAEWYGWSALFPETRIWKPE